MRKLTIYWPRTITTDLIERIRDRFGITAGMTVNGETPAEIQDDDIELLEETARRGFIGIRPYKPELEGLFKVKHKRYV